MRPVAARRRGHRRNEDTRRSRSPVLGNDTDVDGDTLTVIAARADGVERHGDARTARLGDLHAGRRLQRRRQLRPTRSPTAMAARTRRRSTVTVTPVNDAPVAVDDAAATDEDTAVVIPVLGNDTDVDGDALTVTGATNGTNGTVTTNGTLGHLHAERQLQRQRTRSPTRSPTATAARTRRRSR